MITGRIYEWARSDPKKTAAIFNDDTLSYASFFNAIEASRKFFEQHELPVSRTVIVLSKNILEAWIFISALRAIGLNTIAMDSVAHIGELKIKDVACLVVTQSEQDDHNLNCAALAGT